MDNKQEPTPVLIRPFEDVGFRDALFKDLKESRQNFSKMNEVFGLAYQSDVAEIAALTGTTVKLVYNVKDYGALGNNLADNTVPIHRTIALAKVDGGIVFFPPGKYRSRKIFVPSNVELLGVYGASWLIAIDDLNADLVVNDDWGAGNTCISVRNLIIDGNKAFQKDVFAGIKFVGVDNSHILNTYIQNGGYSNVTLKQCENVKIFNITSINPGSVGVFYNDSTDCQLIGGRFKANSGGITGYHAVLFYGGSTDNEVNGIIVRHTGLSSGVTIHTDCHRNKIAHGVFWGCGNGVEVNAADYYDIEDVYCNNERAGSGTYESGIEIVDAQKGKIHGASLVNNYAAGLYVRAGSNDSIFTDILTEDNGWSGVRQDASSHNKYGNCKSIGNEGRGFYFSGTSDYNELNGCGAKNNGQTANVSGVELADSDRNVITGGIYMDDQGAPTQGYGIRETGTSDYNKVHGVMAVLNITGQVTLIGANSVSEDNMVV